MADCHAWMINSGREGNSPNSMTKGRHRVRKSYVIKLCVQRELPHGVPFVTIGRRFAFRPVQAYIQA